MSEQIEDQNLITNETLEPIIKEVEQAVSEILKNSDFQLLQQRYSIDGCEMQVKVSVVRKPNENAPLPTTEDLKAGNVELPSVGFVKLANKRTKVYILSKKRGKYVYIVADTPNDNPKTAKFSDFFV